jgi:hypothetical protein
VGTGDFNIAFGVCLSNLPACLVAVGTQVTHAAVESLALKGKESHWISGLQSPILTGEAGVDLVASTAIRAAWIWIRRLL